MKKTIDCLFIGHNEISLDEYEKKIRKMGTQSGAYRDLNLNFICQDNQPYTVSEIYNIFSPTVTSASQPEHSSKPLRTNDIFSPAIAYLGTYLHNRNFSFDYINSYQDQKEELKEKLRQENILTIAIITTLYVSVFPILEIMKFIKKYNQTARIIVGGPFIFTQFHTQDSDAMKYLLEDTIGAEIYVISSQGEAALVKILHALKNNLPLDQINNIYYKNNQKGYISTAISKENNPLKDNMVNWNLFSHELSGIVNIRTSISCPFSCSFCGFPQRAGQYQFTGVEQISSELNMIDKIQSVKWLHFIDDTFNVPGERFKNILKMMIRSKSRFHWVSNLRCQYADRETVELMKESGCQGVFLGLESANNQVLKNMNKAATVEKYQQGIAWLKEYGILTMGSFIVGFPGETDETIQELTRFIETSGLDFYRAQLWYCEPITPIQEKREQYGLQGESFEWSHRTMDSKKACDWIDRIFLTINRCTWVPQYNFSFSTLWQLILRGMDIRQIKTFLNAFNKGIKEKLKNPSRKNVSLEVTREIKNSLKGNHDPDVYDPGNEQERKKRIDPNAVIFNF